jgi:small subunit ribosomal protein S15
MLNKQEVIKTYRRDAKDTGSSEVQIAILTQRILHLAEHLRSRKKDKHATKGLHDMVSNRKKLIAYLKRTNLESYQKLAASLGFRK